MESKVECGIIEVDRIPTSEAAKSFHRLIKLVTETGRPILIARHGRGVAKLEPVAERCCFENYLGKSDERRNDNG